jgi:hypothetical protein
MRGTSLWVAIALASLCAGSLSIDAAEIDKEIARCAIITGELLRLHRFDDVAKAQHLTLQSKVVSAPSSSGAGSGKWQVRIDTNPIDDSQTVFLSLASTNGAKSRVFCSKPMVTVAEELGTLMSG